MKPFDDQDLIAYHLHELPPRRARALKRALAQDPSLAAEFEAYAAMLDSFKQAPTFPTDEAVFARNWKAILPSLATHRVRPTPQRWRMPALAGAGLAFAATTLFLTTRPSNHAPEPVVSSVHQPEIAATSIPDGRSSSIQAPHARGSIASSSKLLLLRASPNRLIAPLRLPAAPVIVPHFIPLAKVSPLVLPEAPSTPITMEPEPLFPEPSKTRQTRSKGGRNSVHHEHPFDLTLAMGGTLIGTRAVSGTDGSTQGATHAVMAMAAFHQQLRPAVGYRVAVSYTRPGFQYTHQGSSTAGLNAEIDGRMYELATTYVVQGPHRGALTTSVEAGAGVMAFLSNHQDFYSSTSYNVSATGVAGISAEYALTRHLAIHAAYRAQVFKGPDFHYTGPGAPAAATTLISNEPTLGITWRK